MVKCKNGITKLKGNSSQITAEVLAILMTIMEGLFEMGAEEAMDEFTQTAIGILSSKSSKEMQKFLRKDLAKRIMEHCGECGEEAMREIDEAIRENFGEE